MRVSAVVPVYNDSQFILRCVQSILPQLDSDMELIIVDDASDDGTFDLLRRKVGNDGRVVLVHSVLNHGPAAARNTGIRLARGSYITFCDADDEWEAEKLKKQLAYMREHPETDIVYTDGSTKLDDHTDRTGQLAAYAKDDRIHLRTAMIRRDTFDRIGFLDESMLLREDTEWIVRAKSSGCISKLLEEPLYIRHIRKDGLSSKASEEGRKQRIIDSYVRGLRKKKPECLRYDLSILIPMYRAERYIGEALESAVSARYSAEIIVVDDGSADKSPDAVLRYTRECCSDHKTPVTLVTRAHRGQAASRNDAFWCARGRFILYLDADDYLMPGAADTLMDAAEGNEADPQSEKKAHYPMIVSALCRDFISPELPTEEAALLKINPDPYRRMLAGCMLIRRDVFEIVGMYDENLPTSETAQWVLRIRDAGLEIREIDDVVLARRYHRTNLGRTRRDAQLASYAAMLRNRLRK